MARFIPLVAFVCVAACTVVYAQPDKASNKIVVVVRTTAGNTVKGFLSDVTDGSVTVTKNEKVPASQTIQSQDIEWIKYRKKRSALANSALVAGAVVAAGMSAVAWTVTPTGSSEISGANVALGVATGAASLFLISRVIKGLPKTLRVNGNPAVLKDNKYVFYLR
jgi:hypothetical protein